MSETMALEALPEDWKAVSLGEITTKMTNGFVGIATPHYATSENGVPYLYGNNVRSGYLDFRKLLYVTRDFHRSQRKSQLATGDMLTVQSGHIGTCAIVPESLGASNCHALIITRFRENTVNPTYISYCCNSPLGMKRMAALFVGSTIAHINVKEFKSYVLPLPPLPEQRKIASILTTVDRLIEQTEALIEKYRRVKQGMMADLLSRGVDEHGKLRPTQKQAPQLYKQSELGWIPKEWKVERLDSVAEVNRGKFTARPRNDPKFYGGEFPFIQTGDVAGSVGVYLWSFSQTLNALGTTVSKEFGAGTILVTIAANIADTAILGVPMYLPDSVVGVVVNQMQSVRFIELCIRYKKQHLNALAPQTAQKNINLEDLRPLLIPIPDQREQIRVSERYESLTQQITQEQASLAKLRTLKTGLMQDLLTGKVRVKVDEYEEAMQPIPSSAEGVGV